MNTQDGARVELQSLEGHRRILGILFLVMNALTLLVALGFGAVMLFMGQLGMEDAEAEVRAMMFAITLGLTGCFLLTALPGLATGVGLLKRRRWSRTLALVMGILAIPNMPLGTALGIYAIWFYTQPGSDRVFE
ncbi:hypothetical protein [Pyxidicoccus trucidator]|uniref:hypothetical protein n=1 Tax=Pyxidicoccus trucidator TaxID=2709662 RepID=UPI001F07AAC8|nr:hypothetical protein [Pyxidicoccus trucidator]